MSSFTVEANRFQTPTPDHLEAGRVVISAVDGEITAVEQSGTEAAQALTEASADHRVLRDNQVLTPGFIDLHLHAPQWQQNGTALDLPLDEWLFTYTFPLEASFADRAVAEAVYPDLVATLLGHGTTTAAYLSSVHDEATVILAETCVAQGQRAFVGRVAMDHPTGTPDFYRDHDAVSGIERAVGRSPTSLRSTLVETWSGRSSHLGSRRRAPTRCWPGSGVSPRRPGRWCRPIAPRATGSTTTPSNASARATPRRLMPSGSCGSTPCWRTRTTCARATST